MHVIHYHGTPMTPELDMLRSFRGRHAMVSFSDPRDIENACEVCQSVTIDNGAFSAWMNKKPYDFKGYVEFVRKWINHPAVDWCVIPDVIDGDEKANDSLIESWPLRTTVSVPVYHMHETPMRLVHLMRNFGIVAIGSSAEFATVGTPKWWQRMHEVMRRACNSDGLPTGKLHGLRMLDPDIFSHLPLHSADSTNVARNSGIDKAWNGPYAPPTVASRAIVMMNRIESHASARRWCGKGAGVQRNMELLG